MVWARSRFALPDRGVAAIRLLVPSDGGRRPSGRLAFAPCAGAPGAAVGLGAVALRARGSRRGRDPMGGRPAPLTIAQGRPGKVCRRRQEAASGCGSVLVSEGPDALRQWQGFPILLVIGPAGLRVERAES